jgi:hypothetical protein
MNKILIGIVILLLLAIAGVFSYYFFIVPNKGATIPTPSSETEEGNTEESASLEGGAPTSSAPSAKPVAVMPKPIPQPDTKCLLGGGSTSTRSSTPETITALGTGYIKKGSKDICYKGVLVVGADAGSFRALTIRENLPLGAATNQTTFLPAYAYDTYGFYIGAERKLTSDSGMYKPYYAEGYPSTPHFLKVADTFYGFYEGDNGYPTSLHVISGIDAESFKAIGYGYGLDKNRVYYRTTKVPLEADPDTFSVHELNLSGLGDGEDTPHPFVMLGIDESTNKVFHEGVYLEGIDPDKMKFEEGETTLIYDTDTLWYNTEACNADVREESFKKGDITKKVTYAKC